MIFMKEKLYEIMSKFNDIINDIDSMKKVIELQYNGISEHSGDEITGCVLKVHLRLLNDIQNDCEELYNWIDRAFLNAKNGHTEPL